MKFYLDISNKNLAFNIKVLINLIKKLKIK